MFSGCKQPVWHATAVMLLMELIDAEMEEVDGSGVSARRGRDTYVRSSEEKKKGKEEKLEDGGAIYSFWDGVRASN
jgi:hypothetical protein